jgi:hypothetical protein
MLSSQSNIELGYNELYSTGHLGVERTNTHDVWVTIRKELKSRNAVLGKSKAAILV